MKLTGLGFLPLPGERRRLSEAWIAARARVSGETVEVPTQAAGRDGAEDRAKGAPSPADERLALRALEAAIERLYATAPKTALAPTAAFDEYASVMSRSSMRPAQAVARVANLLKSGLPDLVAETRPVGSSSRTRFLDWVAEFNEIMKSAGHMERDFAYLYTLNYFGLREQTQLEVGEYPLICMVKYVRGNMVHFADRSSSRQGRKSASLNQGSPATSGNPEKFKIQSRPLASTSHSGDWVLLRIRGRSQIRGLDSLTVSPLNESGTTPEEAIVDKSE